MRRTNPPLFHVREFEPMVSLSHKLSQIMVFCFHDLGLPQEHAVVKVSGQAESAQFQCNGAMPSSKIAQKNPRQVAQDVIDRLYALPDSGTMFKELSIGGPGFINIILKDEYIASHMQSIAEDDRSGVPVKGMDMQIVLDYGGPNIAKAMHVGHLRSSIIGDSLRRIFVYSGYAALGDVHMGDWGTPMGQIISELEMRHPDWVYFDDTYQGEYPEQSPVTMEDLEKIYPEASAACKSDEARMEIARTATAKLQSGHRGYRALWKHFSNVSIEGMKKNFDALGVHFDLWKGEASVHDLIAPMVDDLKKKGLAQESDGALVVPVDMPDDKKEVPPLILYKRDGAVMYGTTDLATIVERMQTHMPIKIIYVVDQRQSLHFEQVFRAARKAGIAGVKTELTHAGFGTMNGTDGKPFKTRAGGVMKLEDLIAMGIEKAKARLEEADLAKDMDAAERSDIAKKVAIAAIKFADLQNNRIADYVFDIDRMISFEGKTGPYLLYQSVRIKSLLRKAEFNLEDHDVKWAVDDVTRPLSLLLGEFPEYFEGAMNNYTPHLLCDYAYRLAQEFSSFYGNCHILSEENEQLKAARLALCVQTYRQLCLILSLLGIDVPDRM